MNSLFVSYSPKIGQTSYLAILSIFEGLLQLFLRDSVSGLAPDNEATIC
jgi:hypothetical protein